MLYVGRGFTLAGLCHKTLTDVCQRCEAGI